MSTHINEAVVLQYFHCDIFNRNAALPKPLPGEFSLDCTPLVRVLELKFQFKI